MPKKVLNSGEIRELLGHDYYSVHVTTRRGRDSVLGHAGPAYNPATQIIILTSQTNQPIDARPLKLKLSFDAYV